MKTILFAPDINSFVKNLRLDGDFENPVICKNLKEIYSAFSCVSSGENDENRHNWLEVERGRLKLLVILRIGRKAERLKIVMNLKSFGKNINPMKQINSNKMRMHITITFSKTFRGQNAMAG